MVIIIERYYKYLHENPELSGKEYNTSNYVYNEISRYDCTVLKVDLSVIAFFDKGCSKSIAFRSELDALPIQEDIHVIMSKNNNMHACGHDVHTSALLKLGEYINKDESYYDYNIVLIFQSKEESGAGSLDIINSKILEQYNIKRIIGVHLWPKLDYGVLYSNKKLMCGSIELDIIINGLENHVSNYSKFTDATYCSFQIYNYINKVRFKGICHLGKLSTGVIRNVSSKHAKLEYSIRYKNNDKIIKKICNKKYKTKCNIFYKINSNYPVLNCEKKLLDKVKYKKIKQLKSSEDFGNYNTIANSCFFLYGLGPTSSLHTSSFNTNTQQRLNYFKKIKQLLMIYKIE